MTLNQPACGIIALLRLVYWLKTFSTERCGSWTSCLKDVGSVTVCANKALTKHSLFSLYAHMIAVTRLHLKKKSIHCYYFYKDIFSM